jgi:hypothetical protein
MRYVLVLSLLACDGAVEGVPLDATPTQLGFEIGPHQPLAAPTHVTLEGPAETPGGELFTLDLSGALPAEKAHILVGSDVGEGPCHPLMGGYCLDIMRPVNVLGSGVADGLGTWSLDLEAPPWVGATQCHQAVVLRGPSGINTALSDVVCVEVCEDEDLDGECDATGSCQDLLDSDPGLPSGIYELDPDGGGGAPAFEAYCDMENHAGGWTQVINLDTNDATTRDWADTDFWEGSGLVGAAANHETDDYRSQAFHLMPAAELMIIAHDEGAVFGTATYVFNGVATGLTMHEMFTTLSNETVTGLRAENSGSVTSFGRSRNAGDSFIDADKAVIINSTYSPLDSTNFTRIGTNYDSFCPTIDCNGHNYGGLGGQHDRASWGTYYEAAAMNGYCNTQGGYGSNGRAREGKNDAFAGCGAALVDVDFMVFVR